MKSISFFFRHPHPIYFSMEKLFHAVAARMANQPDLHFDSREYNLPFTSKWSTLRKNVSFVRKSQSAINHITGDVHYAILGCSNKNINILTIHDCVLLHHYPKSNPRHWIIRWLWYQLPVRKADIVTVISENTKKDLLHFTNVPAEKIRVIPNFLDPSFQPVPGNFNQQRPKLLFIGTAPNKNLERTVNAIQGLDAELLIVGYLRDDQTAQLKNNNIRFRLLNKLSDQEMRDTYASADILVFPSTLEGFGLPILEAQATGRPVLTSQLEPMVSVSGGASCLVDPYSTESIRNGIKKIIENESYRKQLVEKGFENAARFQLASVTKQYAELYRELIRLKAN